MANLIVLERVSGRLFQLGSKKYLKSWSSSVSDVSTSWRSGDFDTIHVNLLPKKVFKLQGHERSYV